MSKTCSNAQTPRTSIFIFILLRFTRLFAGMIGGFEIGADLVEGEPRRFELAARVKLVLVHVVSTLWIAARAKRVDRKRAHLGRKLNDTDVGSACDSVTPFLPVARRGVNREDSAVVTIHTTDGEARLCILKLFALAFVRTLQARDLTPGNSPRSEITLE